ncbi:MAG: peptidase [Planctomycetaceae bacterium]|nr:peptidase [Planctomycetaceae bacterium]
MAGIRTVYDAIRISACTLILAITSLPAGLFAQDALSPEQIELRLKNSVTYLASDELQGRGIETAGIDKAADYIADQFREIGLETKHYQGTPFNSFFIGTRFDLGPTNQLTLQTADGVRKDLTVRVDFTPLSLSGSGKLDLPLAFVGYGITAPKHNYDDYAGLDVKGHAVIVIRNEPQKSDAKSPFDGAQSSEFAVVSHKVLNAIQHGASAVILVTDQQAAAEVPAGATAKVDPLMAFQVNSTAGNRQIPVVHCRREVIEGLFKGPQDSNLAKLETEIDSDLKPRSRMLTGSRLTGEISLVRKGKPLKNVVGVLPGNGVRADETIVVGAHYDHLGMGSMGSLSFSAKKEIHNGADDNGSGTASLIEVARELKLRNQAQPLPRRVVFIAFTAEESGLIGSEKYLRDPLVPIKDTIAMLNMDMVGRLRNEKLTVYGTGTATEFTPLIDQLASKYQFKLVKKPGGQGPSDHASFYQRKIPVLHFFTGLHKQYHRPDDDAPLLNIAGMRRVSQMVVDSVEEVARASDRPTYIKVAGGDEIEGLAEALLGSDPDDTSESRPRVNKPDGTPYLGISSRAKAEIPGYLIDKVLPQGPAATAGLQSGDVILKFGADAVQKQDEMVVLVKKFKPGEKVKIGVNRNGVELELEVVIGGR